MELIVNIFKKLHYLHNDLPILPERLKIENSKKLVNVNDKTEFAIHIRNLIQPLNHGLLSKKDHKGF